MGGVFGVVEELLDDATPPKIDAQVKNMSPCFGKKITVKKLWRALLHELLEDTSPMLIHRKPHQLVLEASPDQFLVCTGAVVQCCFHDMTAMTVSSQRDNVLKNKREHQTAVMGLTEDKKLLYNVVCENVGHQHVGMWKDFAKQNVELIFGCFLNRMRGENIRQDRTMVRWKASLNQTLE
jgi:hypothetical protein